MNMITYKGCKTKIEKNMYEMQEEMQTMLDVFYMGGRITQDQYEELTVLLTANHEAA
ncbi:hypothetical protein [Sporosarcina sp. P18a]|uniref:hypothetical protein n=1 Tax=Sporosarcina sp. P18a TaxID=2048259 RepID=UPI0013047015|nr:hypothetical protein [Sporosarcina sp. P18a]